MEDERCPFSLGDGRYAGFFIRDAEAIDIVAERLTASAQTICGR